jgi:UDP-N-acetylmuramoylalanine--D-glutamate ligase
VEVRGKRILIFGLARSGLAAANLLSHGGAEITVTDKKTEGELQEYVQQLSPSVKQHLGGHPHTLTADLVVVSPGVPIEIEPLLRAREEGIKIIGELELAYQMVKGMVSFLAITGTNGKSTTTTLLDWILRKSGFSTVLGGNIGKALSEEISQRIKPGHPVPDFVVAEVSSFQLETIDEFRPKGAAILNITPDHLDRYHSLNDYIDAKCRIFQNQEKDDFLVLNADDPMTREIAQRIGKQGARGKAIPLIFYFSREHEVKGAYLRNGDVYFSIPGVSSAFCLKPRTFMIQGVHNLENAMAAAAMALLAGADPDSVAGALQDFPGLEHRLEFVRELDGVTYVNDSKGTNVGAVVKSIEGFSEPVILIAGGRDKAGDFSPLRPLVKEKVKALILIGESAGKMKASLSDLTKTVLVSDLREAVETARAMADRGDVVLLSPACASFDMFRDFEDRGQQFKTLVKGLS